MTDYSWPTSDCWLKWEDGWWQVKEHGVEMPLVQTRRRTEAVAWIRMHDAGLMLPAIITALTKPRAKRGVRKDLHDVIEILINESRHQRQTLRARWNESATPGFCASILRGEKPHLVLTGEAPEIGDEWVLEKDSGDEPTISIQATSVRKDGTDCFVEYKILKPAHFPKNARRTKPKPKNPGHARATLGTGDPVKKRTSRIYTRMHKLLHAANQDGHPEMVLGPIEAFLNDLESDLEAATSREHRPEAIPPGGAGR